MRPSFPVLAAFMPSNAIAATAPFYRAFHAQHARPSFPRYSPSNLSPRHPRRLQHRLRSKIVLFENGRARMWPDKKQGPRPEILRGRKIVVVSFRRSY